MSFRTRSLKVFSLCFVALGARAAHADPSAAQISAARQAFETAVALEADQKWAAATLKLHQALAIKDTPGLRFHLAHCEERQGLLVEASLDYDRASELLRQGANAPDVQKLLVRASAQLALRIPHVTVEIPSDVPNPIAELDGKAYAPSELSLGQALNPGAHQLNVLANGWIPYAASFALKEGDSLSLRADLKRADAPRPAVANTPAPPPTRPSVSAGIGSSKSAAPQRASRKLYWIAGESAVTLAGLALGIGYGLAQSSARERMQAAQSQIDQATAGNAGACSSPNPSLSGTCADLRTAIDEHARDRTVSTVGFACAGVGAAALLTTWLAYPNSGGQTSGPSIQPVVAFGRIGLQGRF
jgi:hypothetical protein